MDPYKYFGRKYREGESDEAGGGGGGGGGNEFLQSLPEDLRGNPSLQNVKDVSDLASQFIEAQKFVGADKIALPGENAKPEDWAPIYEKLGKPKDPENYTLAKLEKLSDGRDLPDNYTPDEKLTKAFRDKAHALNLTKSQAKELYNWYQELEANDILELNDSLGRTKETMEHALKTELGDAYPEYVNLSQQAIVAFGDKDFVDFLENTGLGDDPRFIKVMGEIGKRMQEAEIIGDGGNKSFTMTPDQAKMKIAELQGDQDFMKRYTSNETPGHAEAVEEMNRLFKLANPGGPVQTVGGHQDIAVG